MRRHRGTPTSFSPQPDGLVPSAECSDVAVLTPRRKAHEGPALEPSQGQHQGHARGGGQSVPQSVGEEMCTPAPTSVSRLGSSAGPVRGTHRLKTALINPTHDDS